LKSHPTTGKVLPTYGTTTLVKMVNELGALPTRNYSSGQFERAEEISGDTFLNLISQRGGRTGHACHPGCVIKCSNVFNSSEGEYVTSGLEYETIGMLGANCGISSLDVIAKADRLCDDLGLDTVETGAAIGIAMEAGILNFGDGEAMLSLIREVGKGTIMGRLLGHGSVITGKVLGVNRVPAVKGQSMAAYDPRTLKGVGVTYATSPMGADHTGGNGLGGDVDPLKPEGQIEYSIKFQEAAAYFDSLGLCWFTRAPILGDLTLVTEIANSLFGTDWGPEDIVNIGKMVMRFEKDFNKRAGFNESHDRLPEFMLTEKNRPHETVFDVSAPEMAKLFSKNT